MILCTAEELSRLKASVLSLVPFISIWGASYYIRMHLTHPILDNHDTPPNIRDTAQSKLDEYSDIQAIGILHEMDEIHYLVILSHPEDIASLYVKESGIEYDSDYPELLISRLENPGMILFDAFEAGFDGEISLMDDRYEILVSNPMVLRKGYHHYTIGDKRYTVRFNMEIGGLE